MLIRGYFNITFLRLIVSGLTWVLLLACASKAPVIPAPEPPHASRTDAEPESAREHRRTAAEQLIEQGRQELKKNRSDEAMRSFERAIQIHPNGCVPYYYMAEAWLQKGDLRRALQFNQLALNRAEQDPYWKNRIRDQKRKLKQKN